jgi:hypothetical protein
MTMRIESFEIVGITRVSEGIEVHNATFRVLVEQQSNKTGPNKTGPSGYEESFHK